MDVQTLLLAAFAGLACGFLNTAASSGSAVSLPILMMIGLDPLTANATNRIPVLIGAITATVSFHRHKILNWPLALRLLAPVTAGGLAGAVLADLVPARNLGLLITAAVLVALVLLFSKLKSALERQQTGEPRLKLRHFGLFFLIGLWLGFIVLDGATYLLLALVLSVGLPLAQANALKSFAIIPSTAAAMGYFAYRSDIVWSLGLALGVGSILGGLLGAKLAVSAAAKKWIFWLLVVVISAELVHLAVHYLQQTH